MITIKASAGGFERTFRWLRKNQARDPFRVLHRYGKIGVAALRAATPVETGTTAESWDYRIEQGGGKVSIVWFNTNEPDGVNIAVIRQLGHGTGTGGWVQGIDYINPAMAPIFQQIADDVWKEVIR